MRRQGTDVLVVPRIRLPDWEGGGRPDCDGTSVGRLRWLRMRRITFGSSMSAITSRRSPQRGHASTSKPNLRCISSAPTASDARDDDVALARADWCLGLSRPQA